MQLVISIQETLEQVDTSTDGEDDVKRLRADLRHLREQSPFAEPVRQELQVPVPCHPNSSSKVKIPGARLAMRESRAIFSSSISRKLVSQEALPGFPQYFLQPGLSPCFPHQGTFCSKAVNDPFTFAYKMILGYFSPPLPPLGCLWFAELVRANYIGFFIEGVFPLCMCFLF